MTAEELREVIRAALRVAWGVFVARYPVLGQLIDFDEVLDVVERHFQENPDYQHALADGAARQAGEQEMSQIVQHLVADWLDRLVRR